MYLQIGNHTRILQGYSNKAGVLLAMKRFAEVEAMMEKHLEAMRETRDQVILATALHNLGDARVEQGKRAAARAPLLECARMRVAQNDRMYLSSTLVTLGNLRRQEGNAEAAVSLWALSDALREETQYIMPPEDMEEHRRILAEVQAGMPLATWEAAWRQGQKLAYLTGETLMGEIERLLEDAGEGEEAKKKRENRVAGGFLTRT